MEWVNLLIMEYLEIWASCSKKSLMIKPHADKCKAEGQRHRTEDSLALFMMRWVNNVEWQNSVRRLLLGYTEYL